MCFFQSGGHILTSHHRPPELANHRPAREDLENPPTGKLLGEFWQAEDGSHSEVDDLDELMKKQDDE